MLIVRTIACFVKPPANGRSTPANQKEQPARQIGRNIMKLPRRRFLHLAAGAAALPVLPRITWAQAYPARPVRLVVAFPAGGPGDIVARLLGQRLAERMGQPFIVENRAGASGNVGTEAVVRSAPDGYTLLHVVTNNAINPSLYQRLNFNFTRDISPVAGLLKAPQVMEVNPKIPASTVAEFIAYAKANPGRINMASAGNGSPHHVAGELFKLMTQVDMVHVPYKGSAPALTDLVGGQVDVMFDVLVSSMEFIKAGKLRPLAVTTAVRSEALPSVPTVAETVPGYEASGWQGIGAPNSTPELVIERLNTEINSVLAEPEIAFRISQLGGVAMIMRPSEFRQFIATETEKWAKVVKFADIKPE
jgi:tripartite-type tricarboxylate transporter receptor subunit TctC